MMVDSPVSPPSGPTDLVGESLHRLRVAGVFYCRTEAAGAWSVDMPAFGDCLTFHVVTAGQVHVAVPGTEPVLLRAGDLDGARRASANAKTWCWVATALAIIGLLMNIYFFSTGGMAEYQQMLEQIESMQ